MGTFIPKYNILTWFYIACTGSTFESGLDQEIRIVNKRKQLTADSELLVDGDGVEDVGGGDGAAVLLHHFRELPAQRVAAVLVQRPLDEGKYLVI